MRFYITTTKNTETHQNSFVRFVFSDFFGITFIVLFRKQHRNIYFCNASVLSVVSVILHPVSVMSRQCDYITEKDGNDRKDRNFCNPFI